MCIRDRLQVQLLGFVHAGCQSSACHLLQAHLVLETASSFRLILYWTRRRIANLTFPALPSITDETSRLPGTQQAVLSRSAFSHLDLGLLGPSRISTHL